MATRKFTEGQEVWFIPTDRHVQRCSALQPKEYNAGIIHGTIKGIRGYSIKVMNSIKTEILAILDGVEEVYEAPKIKK